MSGCETREIRLRRLRLRSWRRGIREMDLILGGFADAALAGLDAELLDAFDMLLSENDHDLYRMDRRKRRRSNAVRGHRRKNTRRAGNGLRRSPQVAGEGF